MSKSPNNPTPTEQFTPQELMGYLVTPSRQIFLVKQTFEGCDFDKHQHAVPPATPEEKEYIEWLQKMRVARQNELKKLNSDSAQRAFDTKSRYSWLWKDGKYNCYSIIDKLKNWPKKTKIGKQERDGNLFVEEKKFDPDQLALFIEKMRKYVEEDCTSWRLYHHTHLDNIDEPSHLLNEDTGQFIFFNADFTYQDFVGRMPSDKQNALKLLEKYYSSDIDSQQTSTTYKHLIVLLARGLPGRASLIEKLQRTCKETLIVVPHSPSITLDAASMKAGGKQFMPEFNKVFTRTWIGFKGGTLWGMDQITKAIPDHVDGGVSLSEPESQKQQLLEFINEGKMKLCLDCAQLERSIDYINNQIIDREAKKQKLTDIVLIGHNWDEGTLAVAAAMESSHDNVKVLSYSPLLTDICLLSDDRKFFFRSPKAANAFPLININRKKTFYLVNSSLPKKDPREGKYFVDDDLTKVSAALLREVFLPASVHYKEPDPKSVYINETSGGRWEMFDETLLNDVLEGIQDKELLRRESRKNKLTNINESTEETYQEYTKKIMTQNVTCIFGFFIPAMLLLITILFSHLIAEFNTIKWLLKSKKDVH